MNINFENFRVDQLLNILNIEKVELGYTPAYNTGGENMPILSSSPELVIGINRKVSYDEGWECIELEEIQSPSQKDPLGVQMTILQKVVAPMWSYISTKFHKDKYPMITLEWGGGQDKIPDLTLTTGEDQNVYERISLEKLMEENS